MSCLLIKALVEDTVYRVGEQARGRISIGEGEDGGYDYKVLSVVGQLESSG